MNQQLQIYAPGAMGNNRVHGSHPSDESRSVIASNQNHVASAPRLRTMLCVFNPGDQNYARNFAKTLVEWILHAAPHRWPGMNTHENRVLFQWFATEIVKMPNVPCVHHMAVFVIVYLVATFDEVRAMFTDVKDPNFSPVSPDHMSKFAANAEVCVTNVLRFSVMDLNTFFAHASVGLPQ